jgi:hypothetical protein
VTVLALTQIRADDRCQPRATFDSQLVSQYAEEMALGDTFPPVKVFFDGADYFLADGFHRYHAAKSLGLVDIDADVSEGTLRDAILFSCSANAAHGWRRSNDDKRRAVLRLLNDSEWQRRSDREIARQCGVWHPLVFGLRPSPTNTGISSSMDERTFIHPKTGQETQMRTAKIGRAHGPVYNGPLIDVQTQEIADKQTWRDNATPEAGVYPLDLDDRYMKETVSLTMTEFQRVISIREKQIVDDTAHLERLRSAFNAMAPFWSMHPNWTVQQCVTALAKPEAA